MPTSSRARWRRRGRRSCFFCFLRFAYFKEDAGANNFAKDYRANAQVVVLTRQVPDLGTLVSLPGWRRIAAKVAAWTDDPRMISVHLSHYYQCQDCTGTSPVYATIMKMSGLMRLG